MCFAPQRRALFSTSQLPRVVRSWSALYILTWKCASRHNGVHFFRHLNFQKWSEAGVFLCILTWKCASRHKRRAIFSSLIWPAGSAPARFSEVTFRPSGAPNHWKNTVNRDFPTFSRTCIFLSSDFLHLLSSSFLTSPP